MLVCMGAWAQEVIADGEYYQICLGANTNVGTANNGTRYVSATGRQATHFRDAASYKLIAVGDYYYIQEKFTSKYLGCDKTQVDADMASGSYSRNSSTIVLQDLPETDDDKQYFQWQITLAANSTNVYLIKPRPYSSLSLAVFTIGDSFFCLFNDDSYAFAKASFFQKKVLSLSDFSNTKCYNIYNNRGAWAVGNDASDVNSTASGYGLNLAISSSDSKQQFAFIKYINDYYLYSVSKGKFIYRNGTKLSVADSPNANVYNSKVTLTASTNTTYAPSAPVIITVNNQQFGVSTGYNPQVFGYNAAGDAGNATAIYEAGSFDPSSALSQIESSFTFQASTELNPIYFAWRTAVGNSPSYIHTDNSGDPKNPNNHSITTTNPIDAKYAWQFIGDITNGYLIKNKATGTYLGGRTSSGGAMSMEAEASSYFYPVFNDATNNKWYCKTYDYYIDRSSGAPYAHTSGNVSDYIRLYQVTFELSNDDAGLVVGTETISDFDTPILITTDAVLACENDDYVIKTYDGYDTIAEALENDDDGVINIEIDHEVGVTYHLNWNGSPIASKTTVQRQWVGADVLAAATVFGTAPGYCSYGDPDVSTIGESTTEVNYTLEWDEPFEISDSYASAHWYDMSVRSTWYVTSDNTDNDGALKTVNANALGLATDAYQWAFVGDPFNFKIYNKDKGEDYVYAWTEAANAHIPTFVSAETGNTWTIKASTATNYTNAFMLVVPEYGYQLNQFGGEGGSLKVWNDNTTTNDAGSAFICFDVPDDFSTYVASEIAPYMESSATVFNWTSAARTAIGYDEDYKSSCTYAKYKSMKETLLEKLADQSSFTLPESGKYYYVKNVGTNKYLCIGGANDGLGSNCYDVLTTSTKSAAAVVKVITSNSHPYFVGENLQYSWASASPNSYTGNARAEAEGKYVHYNVTTIGQGAIAFVLGNGEGDYASYTANSYYKDNGSGVVIGGVNSETNAQWVFEEVSTIPLTLNQVGTDYYASLYAPFDVTISGADAYTLDQSGKWLVPTQLTDNQVPAGTAVLLKGTSSSATATINTGSAFSTDNVNDLLGVYVPTDFALDETATGEESSEVDCTSEYFLGVFNNEVGFYHSGVVSKTGYYTLGANKAYLPASEVAAASRGFAIKWNDDEVTGIRTIDGQKSVKNGAFYDLSGRRVENPQHGLYIVNGKKVVIK